jgi:hypothetical protein
VNQFFSWEKFLLLNGRKSQPHKSSYSLLVKALKDQWLARVRPVCSSMGHMGPRTDSATTMPHLHSWMLRYHRGYTGAVVLKVWTGNAGALISFGRAHKIKNIIDLTNAIIIIIIIIKDTVQSLKVLFAFHISSC